MLLSPAARETVKRAARGGRLRPRDPAPRPARPAGDGVSPPDRGCPRRRRITRPGAGCEVVKRLAYNVLRLCIWKCFGTNGL